VLEAIEQLPPAFFNAVAPSLQILRSVEAKVLLVVTLKYRRRLLSFVDELAPLASDEEQLRKLDERRVPLLRTCGAA
jgi:hypothetical protein